MKTKGCYQCPVRVLGCHSGCPWYHKYRIKLEEAKKEKERQNLYSIIPARDNKLPRW